MINLSGAECGLQLNADLRWPHRGCLRRSGSIGAGGGVLMRLEGLNGV